MENKKLQIIINKIPSSQTSRFDNKYLMKYLRRKKSGYFKNIEFPLEETTSNVNFSSFNLSNNNTGFTSSRNKYNKVNFTKRKIKKKDNNDSMYLLNKITKLKILTSVRKTSSKIPPKFSKKNRLENNSNYAFENSLLVEEDKKFQSLLKELGIKKKINIKIINKNNENNNKINEIIETENRNLSNKTMYNNLDRLKENKKLIFNLRNKKQNQELNKRKEITPINKMSNIKRYYFNERYNIKDTNIISPFCKVERDNFFYGSLNHFFKNKSVLKSDYKFQNKLNILYSENEDVYIKKLKNLNEKLKKKGKIEKYSLEQPDSEKKLRSMKANLELMSKVITHACPDLILFSGKYKKTERKINDKNRPFTSKFMLQNYNLRKQNLNNEMNKFIQIDKINF